MQARVARQGEIVIVHLSGRLDVETAEPFRDACLNYLHGKPVVFDFRSLSFVGSSGILPFLQTMQEFAQKNTHGFKFSGVGSEFRKVFAATPLCSIEIFDSVEQAVDAFLRPSPMPQPGHLAPVVGQQVHEQLPSEALTPSPMAFGMLSLAPETAISDNGDVAIDEEAQ